MKEVYWEEKRDSVAKFEPKLAAIIDGLSPTKSLPLLEVPYAFGSVIFSQKIVHLPTNANGFQTVPLYHYDIHSHIKELLDYSPFPLGFVNSRHGVEVYREQADRIHSITCFNEGLNLGIWETFEPPTLFTITAGARSIFLLPKITNSSSYKHLRAYGVKHLPPRSLLEQWYVIREIANSSRFANPWFCEVIYFTKNWFKAMNTDPAWLPLKHYILEKAWLHTHYNRNRFLYDDIEEIIACLLSRKKLKPASYIMDLFKYLIHIALGFDNVMAYRPANGEDFMGPIADILQVILEVYGLDKYAPTMMLPQRFLADKNKSPVYYSLQIPTYWDSAPKSRDSISVKKDLEHLYWLFAEFEQELRRGQVVVNIPDLQTLFDKVRLDFFHTDGELGGLIKPSLSMPETDKNFLYVPGKQECYGKREFASRSSFVRGCVKISAK